MNIRQLVIRSVLLVGAGVFLGSAVSAAPAKEDADSPESPNFVVIFTDDMA